MGGGTTEKKELVVKLLEAKRASGKTYSEIAKEVGLTNLYTAQLFQNQAIICFQRTHSEPIGNISYQLMRYGKNLAAEPKEVVMALYWQTELKPETAAALQAAVPGLTDDIIAEMKVSPLRQYEPTIIQEPLVYRLYEVSGEEMPSHVMFCGPVTY